MTRQAEPLSPQEKPPKAEKSACGVTEGRRGASRLWRREKHQGHGRKLTENSEGKQVARSGEDTLPPPKEVESEREMDAADITQPVPGIRIRPQHFLESRHPGSPIHRALRLKGNFRYT